MSPQNNSFQIIKYVAATILLGAIGSGVWDRFLSDFSSDILSGTANLIGRFSSGYIDYLYSNVGDGMKEVFSYHTYAFFFVSMSFLMLALGFKAVFSNINYKKNKEKELRILKGDNTEKEKDKPNEQEEPTVKTKEEKIAEIIRERRFKHNIFSMFLSAFIPLSGFLMITTTVVKHIYSYNATLYIEKSIDILAPYIEEREVLLLKSDYRRVSDYESFAQLNKTLVSLSEREGVALDKFKIVLK